MSNLKPNIPQLQNSPDKQNQFMKIIEKDYGSKVNQFKNQLMKDLKDKIDINTYLKGLNLF